VEATPWHAQFNATSFLIRWLVALALVLATFNPTQYSFPRWITGADSQTGFNTDHMPYKVLIGAVPAVLYVIYPRATWRSIGAIGVGLAIIVFGALIWAAVDAELLDLRQGTALSWVLLVLVRHGHGGRPVVVAYPPPRLRSGRRRRCR